MANFQVFGKIGLILLLVFSLTCNRNVKWKGQAPIRIVPTTTLPIQKQYKGLFELGNGIYVSNDFEGARLNGIVLTEDDLITALITPENTPINPSPWYAFKIWAEEQQDIRLKLTYLDGASHRYHPKLSYDGSNWEKLPEEKYTSGEITPNSDERQLPKDITMQLSIGPDTLWVAAQELKTSKHVARWIEQLTTLPYVSSESIGESREGRPIHLLRIGEGNDEKMIFVLSRQHPPEVTGFLAMQSFVETIASDDPLAKQFRQNYTTYVVPFANPDGVDNGHWRHSTAGIDLNRDWENVNQPEVAAIQNFMESKVASGEGKFYFAVDFHSTWEDIYYTINPEFKGNMPGLVPQMINAMAEELKLDPNIRPGDAIKRTVTSSNYFFHTYGAESLTYEIGDGTPRDLLKKKGSVSAMKLMELLLDSQ